jgi:hypothetical protein
VLADHVREEPRHLDRANPAGLGGPGDDRATDLAQRLHDVDRAGEDVHALGPQRPQLAGAEAAVRGDVDGRPVWLVLGGRGEHVHLVGIKGRYVACCIEQGAAVSGHVPTARSSLRAP